MKKSIFRLFALVALVGSVALTSCNTDAEGALYNGNAEANYSFASTKQVSEVTDANEGKVLVPVNRGVTTGEQTIKVDAEFVDGSDEVLKVASNDVTFKDGEGVAYLVLDYGTMSNLGATAKYKVNFTLPDGTVSESGNKSITVVISRKLTWKYIGTGTYTAWLFGQTWEQKVEKAEEGNVYRLPDCITEGYPIIFALSDDGQSCTGFDTQETGYKHSSYGMVSIKYLWDEDFVREGNTLKFPVAYIVSAGSFGKDYDTLVLPE